LMTLCLQCLEGCARHAPWLQVYRLQECSVLACRGHVVSTTFKWTPQASTFQTSQGWFSTRRLPCWNGWQSRKTGCSSAFRWRDARALQPDERSAAGVILG